MTFFHKVLNAKLIQKKEQTRIESVLIFPLNIVHIYLRCCPCFRKHYTAGLSCSFLQPTIDCLWRSAFVRITFHNSEPEQTIYRFRTFRTPIQFSMRPISCDNKKSVLVLIFGVYGNCNFLFYRVTRITIRRRR